MINLQKLDPNTRVVFAQADLFDNTLFLKQGLVMKNLIHSEGKTWVLFEDIGLRYVPINCLELINGTN